jgi:mannosyltransferase
MRKSLPVIEANDSSRRSALVLSAIVLLGLALRLFRLDSQCLWIDELATLQNATRFDDEGLWGLARADHIAPLHSILIWATTQWLGDSAFWLRLPSVAAGVLTIPAVYWLTVRLLRSSVVGLVAAALVAVSPFAIWYSQEARMYAFLLLFGTLYVLLSWPVLSRRLTGMESFLLAVVTAAGLYSHHYMALLMLTFGLFLLWQLGVVQARLWTWAAWQVAACIAFIPWLILTADKVDAQAGLAKPMMVMWAPYALYTFVAGFSFGPAVSELRTAAPLAAVRADLGPILALLGAVLIVGFAGLRELWREHRVVAVWCLVWALLPIALAMSATLVTNISFNVRYVIVSFPPVMIILAAGMVSAFRSRVIAVAAIVLATVTCVSLYGWYTNPRYAKEDVRPLARLLSEEYRSGQLLVLANAGIGPVLAHYGFAVPRDAITVPANTGGEKSALAPIVEELQSRAPDASEVWLVEFRGRDSDPERILTARLDSIVRLSGERQWAGVRLRRYRPHVSP